MKYTKPPLTIDEQIELLIKRGMEGSQHLMRQRLTSVNYYRLSGYWHIFREPDDTFRSGTSFEQIWSMYAFDRHLRLLVMDAIERIEIAVRSLMAYHHAHQHGTFAYAVDPSSLPKRNADEHAEFLARLSEEVTRSRERFVQHFWAEYGNSHDHLPVWMVTEVMSFGSVLSFFRSSSSKVKTAVSSTFGMPHKVFDSWLLTLNTVRNICAHHARLWNRELGTNPVIPRLDSYPEWHTPVKVENKRVFAVLTICRHCLSEVAAQSKWKDRLESLLDQFPAIPLENMGFPDNWKDCPIWKG
ncbi:MAG: hypothetical protein E4H08_08435 [Candidatus Atribacteria bacterium]|nr:MAG: hypothetical protein E4H08_08435 [Candidatus Atribacteria bacterium]